MYVRKPLNQMVTNSNQLKPISFMSKKFLIHHSRKSGFTTNSTSRYIKNISTGYPNAHTPTQCNHAIVGI